ncbi:ROK family protein [Thermostaphylospora chromogena]|uniref:Kanosamine 6-kinase n=1 Tax=Thermostaphylospora chromogena TaxID=35622 RepID=A0A1H1I7A2_9ACTN|nr:ROK family protein [Thermostaphylospora chromogena]SDR33591.1 kanosamine 6-kinase [Thermostaphylospora chromogena]
MTYLGIDVGGTKVALRAESAAGTRELRFAWAAAGTVEADLELLASQARALLAELPEPVVSVGVAMPATVGPDGRVAAWPSRPGWIGVDLPAALGEVFGTARIAYADDGDLAALAESAVIGGDLVYLGVGTGVGGGIVLDGRPVPGAELGHMVVDLHGESCPCGRRGCVQALASGPAILRRAARFRGTEVSAAEFPTACRTGAVWALAAVESACLALAAAVVGVGEALGVTSAVIGGGFADAVEGFAARVAARVADLARPGHPPPRVRAAALGADSSLTGAVLLARDGSTIMPTRVLDGTR